MSDQPDDKQARKRVIDRAEYIDRIREAIWQQGVSGGLDDETKRQLAAAAISYHDALRVYRDESIIEKSDFPDISPLKERLFKKTEIRKRATRPGDGCNYESVPAISEVDGWRIIDVTYQLDDVAKQLGFAATTADSVDRSQFDEGDLVTLLETRDQSEALGEMPEGDA